jgi:hypothetical protein
LLSQGGIRLAAVLNWLFADGVEDVVYFNDKLALML